MILLNAAPFIALYANKNQEPIDPVCFLVSVIIFTLLVVLCVNKTNKDK